MSDSVRTSGGVGSGSNPEATLTHPSARDTASKKKPVDDELYSDDSDLESCDDEDDV